MREPSVGREIYDINSTVLFRSYLLFHLFRSTQNSEQTYNQTARYLARSISHQALHKIFSTPDLGSTEGSTIHFCY